MWNPLLRLSIDKIHVEGIQQRTCMYSMILDIRNLPYQNQLKCLGILSLQARRSMIQVVTIYKLHAGLITMDPSDLFDIHTVPPIVFVVIVITSRLNFF